jgi:heme/copper-type cytochrome/quinol oxidase subunit 2
MKLTLVKFFILLAIFSFIFPQPVFAISFQVDPSYELFILNLLSLIVFFFLIYFCISLIVFLIKLVLNRKNQEKKSAIVKRLKKNFWFLIITISILYLLRFLSASLMGPIMVDF